jgi:hypothetical protein
MHAGNSVAGSIVGTTALEKLFERALLLDKFAYLRYFEGVGGV